MKNMAKKKLLLIGYETGLESLCNEIGLMDGEFDAAPDAKSGLKCLSEKNYELLILNADLPAGNSFLPRDVHAGDGVEMGCYVIKNIRKEWNNRGIRIFVIPTNSPPAGYSSKQLKKEYTKAGATICFDAGEGKYSENFKRVSSTVKQYL